MLWLPTKQRACAGDVYGVVIIGHIDHPRLMNGSSSNISSSIQAGLGERLRICPDRGAVGRTSGFCASIRFTRNFFVQGVATVAIESDALEAAR
jgi:hypothetical protein